MVIDATLFAAVAVTTRRCDDRRRHQIEIDVDFAAGLAATANLPAITGDGPDFRRVGGLTVTGKERRNSYGKCSKRITICFCHRD